MHGKTKICHPPLVTHNPCKWKLRHPLAVLCFVLISSCRKTCKASKTLTAGEYLPLHGYTRTASCFRVKTCVHCIPYRLYLLQILSVTEGHQKLFWPISRWKFDSGSMYTAPCMRTYCANAESLHMYLHCTHSSYICISRKYIVIL